MSDFVIADLHFGETCLCNGSSRSGQGRPFRDVRELASVVERRWNQTVMPTDTVFVLGDIGRPSSYRIFDGLHGTKHLVAGNADDLVAVAGCGFFKTITIARWLPGFLLTHIPVHPSQLRGSTVNVHGHLHSATVGDPRYRCVSVEQTDFAPIPLKDLSARSAQASLL